MVDRIDSLFMTNRLTQRVKGVGILIYGLSQTVERILPDFLFVVGDREESIATAIVGNYMNILVAHLGGGDPVYGNADDPIRFAVSKLAHIHFTTCEEYRNNLIKLGEEEFRVFNVGNPSLDKISKIPYLDITEINRELGIDLQSKRYIILIKHPLSSEFEKSYEQMKITFEVLNKFCQMNNIKAIGIYPNTDPGSYDIIKAINEINSPFIKFIKNIPRIYFVNLLRNALALVGNSSMNILEAPFYQLPSVNIGNRQKGRLNAGNVLFTGYNENEILHALHKACFDNEFRSSLEKIKYFYGDGKASERIVNILKEVYKNKDTFLVKTKLI